MVDNTERLSQIMQRMQVSNQRTLGNRFGGGYSGVSSATAPTPPSEQIDFTKNTLSPPSMAQPDDTEPGQQMPSVIQPPASGNVGMPSGGNAYSGNQPGVSPSTRDLYSLPDYSGGMRGGMGGDDRLDRLLKMLSSYMGSQNGQPSPAPPPAAAQEGIGYVPVIGVGTPGQATPDMQSAVGSNGLDFGMTNDPAEQARRQAQQRMDFQAANPGQSMDNALKGLTPGGLTPDMQISTGEVRYTPEQIAEAEAGFASGRIKKLNIPSLSSLDGRSPQAMPTKPATMGDEFKTLRLASGERENKFNALSEQEKASILRNLKISTYGR
jgi:hypothetical protein